MARYLDLFAKVPSTLGYGLREKLKEGYHAADFRADLMAGLVVGVVALPLSMALAIASGVPPQHGLYTAIIAGIVCSLLGGTRFQVTGPTAAFVVILVPIVTRFGLGGLLVAKASWRGSFSSPWAYSSWGTSFNTFLTQSRPGSPPALPWSSAPFQLKDFLGLRFDAPEGYLDRWRLMVSAHGTASGWGAWPSALLTMGHADRHSAHSEAHSRRPLIALTLVSALATALATRFIPDFHVATIGSRFYLRRRRARVVQAAFRRCRRFR